MSQPAPISNVISHALQLSQRMEERRCELENFEVRRLEKEVARAGNNALTAAIGDVLIGEIERDFQRVDAGADQLLSFQLSIDLLADLASGMVFSFNPEMASTLVRRLLVGPDTKASVLNYAMLSAWRSGNVMLCREIMQRLKALKTGSDEYFLSREIECFIKLLEQAGVTPSEYREAIARLHSIIRLHLSGKRNVRVMFDFGSVRHEDGYEGIVVEVLLAGMAEDDFDCLDDALLDWVSDPDQVSASLAGVVTFLVRDVTELKSVKEAS